MGPFLLYSLGLVLLMTGNSHAMDIEGRLAGGDNVTLHAPYMAHIQPIGPMGEMKETCGGAIINTTLILTTASCMFGAVAAKVKAGSPITEANETETGSQFTTATQIFYYPDYYQNTRANDIAIVRVDPPFNTTEYVDVIQLAKGSLVKGDALANKTVAWTSFGMINETDNSTALQLATVKPIKTKACEAIFKGGPFFVKLPKSVMCIEVTDKGMCAGDAGSPLVAFNPKDKVDPTRPYLAALAAWNHDKNCPPNETISNNTPDWFTRVEPFYKWINAMGGPKAK